MEKRGSDTSLLVLLVFIVLFFAFLLFAKPQDKIMESGMATFEWQGGAVGGTNAPVGGTSISSLAQNKTVIAVVVGAICLVLFFILIAVAKKKKKMTKGGEVRGSVAADMGGGAEDASGKDLGLSEDDINHLFEEPNGKQQLGMSPIEEAAKYNKIIKTSESKPMMESNKKYDHKEEKEMKLDIEAPTPKSEADISKVASIKVAPDKKPSVYLGDVMTKIDSKVIKIDYKIIKAKIIEMLKNGFPMNRIVSVLLEKGVEVNSINQAIAEINSDNLRVYLVTCLRNGVGLNYAHKVLLSKGWSVEQIKKVEAVIIKKK